ncbi:hypothetical protein [Nitrobacter sp.]|uniref:hypothetical protein n=1 Tax=Nitrobacter sp. TaxID=29420 RepID=UPI003F64BC35
MKRVSPSQGKTLEAAADISVPVKPVPVTPEEFFRAWSRKDTEALVEVLIASLDKADADPDLESLLGAPEVRDGHERRAYVWARGATDDREGDAGCDDREDVCEDEGAEHDGSEPDVDGEPILGAFDSVVNQERSWVTARQADELDDCDLEDTGDDEPSIGGDDREDDFAERSGIGDVEGLLEQTEFGRGFAVAVE